MSDILVSFEGQIAIVQLNRPKTNAFTDAMIKEIPIVFKKLQKKDIRAVIVTGSEKIFSSGLDFKEFTLKSSTTTDRALEIMDKLSVWQQSFSTLESFPFPVIGVISGPCIGAGVDLCCCMDLRLCTESAYFSVKEVDLGIAADLGTLQRLPKIINSAHAFEWSITGRKVTSQEAQEQGFVLRTLISYSAAMEHALKLCRLICLKNPMAIRGIKKHLLFSRDNCVGLGLQQIAIWNASMLQSNL